MPGWPGRVTGDPRSDHHEEAGVHATVLAGVPSNVEAGAYMTFAGPVIAFCVVAAILYVLLFARPHPRVPPSRLAATAHAGPPGVSAAGGGSVASAAQAPGAGRDATTTGDRGSVSGGTADGAGQEATDETEDGE
jgi:hypothetical protein